MKSKRQISDKVIKLLLSIPLLVYGLLNVIKLNPDSDMTWLVATGRYITENGFPKVNPFIWHEDYRIVIENWIPAIINFEIYKMGYCGLYLYSFIVYILQVIVLNIYYKLFNDCSTTC